MYDRIIINSQSDLRKRLRDEYVFEKVIIMYAVTIYNTLTTKYIIISVSRVFQLSSLYHQTHQTYLHYSHCKLFVTCIVRI